MDLFRPINYFIASIAVCSLLFVSNVHAAHDDDGDLSWVGVRWADVAVDEEGGPSGSGFGLVLELSDDFSLGLDYQAADKSVSSIVRNTAGTMIVADATEETDAKSGSIILNYHPLGNSFYISGGVMFTGDTKVTSNRVLRTDDDPGVTIGLGDSDMQFGSTAFNSLQGKVTYTNYAPYIGIGWNPFRSQSMISPYLNIGVVFNLHPSVTITDTGACSSATPPAGNTCVNLEQALLEEAASQQSELDDYFWTASAGIILRFF